MGSSRSTRASSGRGAHGKTVVFGIFERQGHVYTEIVPDCSTPTLQGIIRGRVDPRTVINADGWRGYHGLVDLGDGHVRVDHARDECTKGTVHITGIEGFWGLAKVRLFDSGIDTLGRNDLVDIVVNFCDPIPGGSSRCRLPEGPAETHLPPPSQGDRRCVRGCVSLEWRYNHRRADKYKGLLQYLRKNPLS